jgi:hypothetical protein
VGLAKLARSLMNSKSQAGQDMFVATVLNGQRNGTFLEIGTNNPVEINNTYMLETEYGWRGLLVDNSFESMLACEKERKSAFQLTDASQHQNWIAALQQAEEINHGASLHPPRYCDYLSLDIDGATLECLRNLPLDRLQFRVVTVEHDAYRNGPIYRQAILDIMYENGYDVLCCDVADAGLSFEAWAVMPELVDMTLANKFRRSQPTEWREFFV